MNGTHDRIGANVLKRFVGVDNGVIEEYNTRSHNFPGHEMRMRNHTSRVAMGMKKADKLEAELFRERKLRAKRAAYKRKKLATKEKP